MSSKCPQVIEQPETLEDPQIHCPCSLPLLLIKLHFSHLTLTQSQFLVQRYIGIQVLTKERQMPGIIIILITQQPVCSCDFSRHITKILSNPTEMRQARTMEILSVF